MKSQTIKKSIPLFLLSVCSVAVVVFTVFCMTMFKRGFLHEHAVVISSVCVTVEIFYISATAILYVFGKETAFKLLLSFLILAAFMLLGLFLFQVTGFWDKIDTVDKLQAFIQSTGPWTPIVFILIQALQVFLIPIPGVLTVGAGVLMFGEFWTCIYSYVGILLGSFCAFWIGRVAGYRVAAWLVGKEALDKWLQKVKGKDKMLLTAMFILPMFPDDILCFVSGLSTMSWKFFIIMQLVARALSVVTTSYSLGGRIIPYDTWWGILLWILLAAAIIAFFIFLYKKGDKIEKWFYGLFKKKKKDDKDGQDDESEQN